MPVEWTQASLLIWLIVLTCTQAVTLFLWLKQRKQSSALRQRYKSLFSQLNREDAPELLVQLTQATEENQQQIRQAQQQLQQLAEEFFDHSAHIGICRYNAFSEVGNDLSFSLAILNHRRDGVVVTGIYNRGESNIYAKPLKAGASSYPLSAEELRAIRSAFGQEGDRNFDEEKETLKVGQG